MEHSSQRKGEHMAIPTNDVSIPLHIGIIMDGNRRWAKSRGLPPEKGHEKGAETLAHMAEYCEKIGVKTLTVYALSTENLQSRAKRELAGLMKLLGEGIQKRLEMLQKHGISITVLGELKALPSTTQRLLHKAIKELKDNERMKINIALNYGGRAEIVHAVQEIIKQGLENPKEITEELIEKHLYTNGKLDPDLVIRTGGQIRLSNFLLWQTSYSELYFTDTLWPDFSPEELDKAIAEYTRRKRNFGK